MFTCGISPFASSLEGVWKMGIKMKMEMMVLEKESDLAVYYEVCNILFPSLHYSGFPFNPVDKSLLSGLFFTLIKD